MRFSTVLGAYYFAYFAYVGAYSPYITLYFKELGMTAAQIGLLYSIPQVMRIFGPSAWGHLADSSGRPQVILRAAAVCSLIAFAGMYWHGGGASHSSQCFRLAGLTGFIPSCLLPSVVGACTSRQVRWLAAHRKRARSLS